MIDDVSRKGWCRVKRVEGKQKKSETQNSLLFGSPERGEGVA